LIQETGDRRQEISSHAKLISIFERGGRQKAEGRRVSEMCD
jgi:hypothetical protein